MSVVWSGEALLHHLPLLLTRLTGCPPIVVSCSPNIDTKDITFFKERVCTQCYFVF